MNKVVILRTQTPTLCAFSEPGGIQPPPRRTSSESRQLLSLLETLSLGSLLLPFEGNRSTAVRSLSTASSLSRFKALFEPKPFLFDYYSWSSGLRHSGITCGLVSRWHHFLT